MLVDEGVLAAERSHKLVGRARAQLTSSTDKAGRILRQPHGPPLRGVGRLPRNVQLHRSEAGGASAATSAPSQSALYS